MSKLIIALAVVLGLGSGLAFLNVASTGPHPFAAAALIASAPLLAAGILVARAERERKTSPSTPRTATGLFAVLLVLLAAAFVSFAAGLMVVFVLLPAVPLLAIMLPIVAVWPRDHREPLPSTGEEPQFVPHAPLHGHA